MQLKSFILVSLLVFFWVKLSSQNKEKDGKYKIDEIEVDFLFSYYEQEGDHSAVQGGVGDQHLTDFVSGIVINVPIDTSYIINLKYSLDAYTSASTNRIDDPTNPLSEFYELDFVSSASYGDERSYGNLGLTKLFSERHSMIVGAGFSTEYDVNSFSLNLGGSWSSRNKNTSISLTSSGIFDTWELIYPGELRSQAESTPELFLSTNKRRSFNGALILSQILTPKLQASLAYDVTLQSGLLSTPFHRVYFDDGFPLDDPFKAVHIERLPDTRLKQAIGLRVNAFPFNALIIRSFFRYYFDSFGIEALTGELELPVKFTRFVSAYPFYRYSSQTASDYFQPFGVHVWSNSLGRGIEDYYTSDYDLSELNSHKYGLGVRISPAFGIARTKKLPYVKRSFAFKSIDLRGGLYERSDGLKAFFGAINLSFIF